MGWPSPSPPPPARPQKRTWGHDDAEEEEDEKEDESEEDENLSCQPSSHESARIGMKNGNDKKPYVDDDSDSSVVVVRKRVNKKRKIVVDDVQSDSDDKGHRWRKGLGGKGTGTRKEKGKRKITLLWRGKFIRGVGTISFYVSFIFHSS